MVAKPDTGTQFWFFIGCPAFLFDQLQWRLTSGWRYERWGLSASWSSSSCIYYKLWYRRLTHLEQSRVLMLIIIITVAPPGREGWRSPTPLFSKKESWKVVNQNQNPQYWSKCHQRHDYPSKAQPWYGEVTEVLQTNKAAVVQVLNVGPKGWREQSNEMNLVCRIEQKLHNRSKTREVRDRADLSLGSTVVNGLPEKSKPYCYCFIEMSTPKI